MEFESCAVCKRTILRGERSFDYVDSEGAAVSVCALCVERAEALAWLPAGAAPVPPPPEPRRRRGATALRERFARAAAPPSAPRPASPPTPLDVFNASPEVRKVAGLRRSLGEPRVCVRPDLGGGGEVVIVAWDLSWYRWSVRDGAVKQLAKGNEISELPVSDRDWNARADEDGRLSRA